MCKRVKTYVMSCPFRALSLVFMAPWTVAKQVPIPMAIIQCKAEVPLEYVVGRASSAAAVVVEREKPGSLGQAEGILEADADGRRQFLSRGRAVCMANDNRRPESDRRSSH